MINDNEFFFMHLSNSLYNLCMYKTTFGKSSVDWTNTMACPFPSTTCIFSTSKSLVSSDKTIIFSNFIYGDSSTGLYLYFISLNATSGSVLGSRYKSSIALQSVQGSAISGTNIISTVLDSSPSSYIVI